MVVNEVLAYRLQVENRWCGLTFNTCKSIWAGAPGKYQGTRPSLSWGMCNTERCGRRGEPRAECGSGLRTKSSPSLDDQSSSDPVTHGSEKRPQRSM